MLPGKEKRKLISHHAQRERERESSHCTLKLFFFTPKPKGPAASSIFEIISLAGLLDVNLVSLLTSSWLVKEMSAVFLNFTQAEPKRKR